MLTCYPQASARQGHLLTAVRSGQAPRVTAFFTGLTIKHAPSVQPPSLLARLPNPPLTVRRMYLAYALHHILETNTAPAHIFGCQACLP